MVPADLCEKGMGELLSWWDAIMKSKFKGCMVGDAIGDSLGAGSEGRCIPGRKEESGVLPHQLTYTDDAHMMSGVAESLIECRGFNRRHMAFRLLENYEREPYRGYGPGPPRIFRLVRRGKPWEEAASTVYPGGSYGNGAAMRVAPLALFYYDDPEELKIRVEEASQITHTHVLGIGGAILQAYAIALATKHPSSEPLGEKEFIEPLLDLTDTPIYHGKIEGIKTLVREKPSRGRVVRELGNGVEAFNSVPTAIYSFLSHSEGYEKSVLYAISLGGDADTIAGMTGAISGAYHGVEAIPNVWRENLENNEYIEGLAEALWKIKFRDD